MATKRVSTRLLSLLLTAVTLFSLIVTAQAASIGDGSTTCKVSLKERHHYLTTTAGTALGASAYQYTSNDGLSGPAYCIDHGLSLTADTLPITGKYDANPSTAGAFANGYPQHSVDIFLGLYLDGNAILTGLTEDEFAYATQIAVWATLGQLAVDGTGFTSGRERLTQPTGDSQQMRVFRAVQLILNVAKGWNRVPQTGMYIRLTDNELGGNIFIPPDMTLDFAADNERYGIKREVIGGKSYYTREYIYASATSTYYNDYTIELWATGAPAGTIFVDTANKELPRSTWKETGTWRLPVTSRYTAINTNGAEYYGKAKLCIPVETAPNSGEITLHSAAKIMQYEIYLAYNKKNSQQSYIISDPSKGTQDANAVLTWGGRETETGKLHITKVGGGGMVLPGATFTLTGTDGNSRTGTTNSAGVILWTDLDPNVTYTLTETDPPPGYGAIDPINLTIKAAQISYVTVQDDTLHKLVVRKIDRQTGYSLNGAVIRFEQIDGSFTTTKTTDHAGMIQMDADKLPIGSYKVYEVSAPEGYDLDPTPQTVHWDGKKDVTLTLSNVRKPTLTIYKCDEGNRRNLPGATFEVYKNGQRVTTVTTNDNGLAYVSGISTGYYTVKETVAPPGYVLDNKEHSVYVDLYDPATTDDPRLVVENAAKPSLRIIKYDRQSMKPLPDITFEVYRDTVLVGSYTTGRDGEILLTTLDPGTYTVKEVAAPGSHVVNSTPQQIELKAGQGEIATLIFLNSLKPGIHIVKLDSVTMKPLVNATYLISKVGGSFAKEYTTDVNGEIDLSKLEPGTYTVKETRAPEGYLIDDGIRIIQLNPDENAQFVFTDTPKPGMVVVKYDPQNDKYLPGATFRIAKIEDGSHYLDRVSDTNGRITLTGLEPGIYSVTELAAPEGYVRNNTEYHVELFPGKTSELVVTNKALPNLKIIKTDAITGEPIQGVTFTVRKADSATLSTITTGADGTVTLEKLDPGVYEVTEQSVPDGYLLDTTPQLVTLVPGKTAQVQFQNYPKPGLTIHKIDSITGDSIKGAKFQITYAASNSFGGATDLGFYYSDENGLIKLSNLKDGWYRVTEVEPAPGYAIKDPAVQEFYLEGGKGKVLTFENTPLNALIIKKVDAVSGDVLQGAKFRVRYFEGVTGTGGTTIGEYTTSAQGTIVITGLKAGTYIVEETKAPDGYVIDDAPKTVYLSGKEQAAVTVEFANQPDSGLTITKLDSVSKNPLAGATFEIRNSAGGVVGNANGIYVTNASGTIHLPGLPTDTYIIKETKAPTGYVLDGTPQTVKLVHGETHSLTFYNTTTPEGGLRIVKLDEKSRQPIKGVEFEVTHMDGRRVGTYRTNSSGIINLHDLTPGWYTVVEKSAAEGYELDAQPRDVEVREGRTATVEVTNRQQSGIVIRKVDSSTGEGLYGAVFVLYDGRGNPIGEFKSNQRGYVYIDGLTDGRYQLREIEAPEGYTLDNDRKTVYVRYGGSSEIRWENTAIKGQIQIVKKSTDYNSTNGLPAGSLLAGATFEIYHERSGNKVDTIVSGANGLAVSKQLPLGRYTVREVKAPANYATGGGDFTAVLEYSGQIVRFEVTNKSVSTGVSITKTGPKEAVSGQPVRYVFSGIANTGNVPLDSFYWKDTFPAQVTLNKVVTGSYNRPGSYKIVYRVNGGDYRTLADNLSTAKVYTLDATPAILGLAANEKITEIMFVFGQAPGGFAQVEAPTLHCAAAPGLTGGSTFVNVAEVGGIYGGQWVQAVSRWVTTVYGKPVTLPRTGY